MLALISMIMNIFRPAPRVEDQSTTKHETWTSHTVGTQDKPRVATFKTRG